jgi:prevent-host-death family protein
MQVPITEAKAQLTDLVRRAEAGEVIVLTRHGRPAARIVAETEPGPMRLDRPAIDAITARALAKFPAGHAPSSNHDDLYDENGLPK